MHIPHLLAALALAVSGMTAQPLRAQTAAAPESLAGTYDGSEREVAAALELGASGRFRYMLTYGALDEQAEGVWRVEDGQVVLTSDPVTPPRFVLLDRRAAPAGRLRISLETPDGMSPQYFTIEVRRPDGSVAERHFSNDDGLLDLDPDDRPAAIAVTLPIFDLRSDSADATGGAGAEIRFRFEPHDLGKVAFARTPLRRDGGDLILLRHDLTLRFRRSNQ